jgi:CRISPR/Cas system-associated exonuclease Cas4 (RecB family)
MTYTIDEGAYKPQKPGITLSPSSIDTMEKCPRQYFLQYIAKIKVKDEKPANTFGKMMHLVAENYKGGGGDEIKGLAKCFQTNEKLRAKYWDKLDDEYKNKIPQGLKNLHYYLTKRYPLTENFKHEECLDLVDFDKVGETNIHLQGKLDGIYELSSRIWITDFKSGKKTKDHSGQLGFYLFLLNKLRSQYINGRDVIAEVVNICLEDGTVGEKSIEHHKLEDYDYTVAEKRIKKAIHVLKSNGITIDDKEKWKPKSQVLCKWCKFYKVHCDPDKKSGCQEDFELFVE